MVWGLSRKSKRKLHIYSGVSVSSQPATVKTKSTPSSRPVAVSNSSASTVTATNPDPGFSPHFPVSFVLFQAYGGAAAKPAKPYLVVKAAPALIWGCGSRPPKKAELQVYVEMPTKPPTRGRKKDNRKPKSFFGLFYLICFALFSFLLSSFPIPDFLFSFLVLFFFLVYSDRVCTAGCFDFIGEDVHLSSVRRLFPLRRPFPSARPPRHKATEVKWPL